jgi:hypothetical protein
MLSESLYSRSPLFLPERTVSFDRYFSSHSFLHQLPKFDINSTMWWPRKSPESYNVLLADSDSGDDEGSLSEHGAPKPGRLTRRTLLFLFLLALSCALNLAFFAIVVSPGPNDGTRLLQDISGLSRQIAPLFCKTPTRSFFERMRS